jgi:lipoprotein NlpD
MKKSMKLSCALPKTIHTVASAALITLLLAGCATTTPAPVTDRTSRPGGQTLPPPVAGTPAPIYDRSAPQATTTGTAGAPMITSVTPISPSAPGALPSGPSAAGNTPGSQFHVVQKGENLYRIALNNGIDLNNLAAWNNITAVTPIREGQVLRLRPLDLNAPTVTSGAAGGTVPRAIEGQPLPAPSLSVQPSAPASAPGATSAIPAPAITPIDVPVRRDPVAQRQPYSDSALAQMQREAASSSAASAASASGAAAGATTVITPPPVVAPVIEAQVRPGAGIDREGTLWTWPTSGRIASKFNERAAMKGIDISANIGTPVVAAAPGKVIYVGKEPRGFGQMIVVSHAKETVSVYFHTDKVAVKEQQRVTLGQRMAEVSDGSGNKMHFEVRRSGRPIDPIALMPN